MKKIRKNQKYFSEKLYAYVKKLAFPKISKKQRFSKKKKTSKFSIFIERLFELFITNDILITDPFKIVIDFIIWNNLH